MSYIRYIYLGKRVENNYSALECALCNMKNDGE